jgi:hypothetical protein
MKRILLLICLWAFGIARSVCAAEITYSHLNPYDGARNLEEGLLVRGEIVPGDYEDLVALVKSDPDRFRRAQGVILASPGGDIREALRIARFVRGTYSSVYVGSATGPCVSACFFIYSSAVFRIASTGTLGVHRPYLHPRRIQSMSAGDVEESQRVVLREARKYLEDQDVPTNLIDRMFQRASTEVYWLTRAEIEDQLGSRPPWYEQFLIAKCGLDKAMERRYFSTNDKKLLKQLKAVTSCGDNLTATDAESFLNRELARAGRI